ncbi:MAG: hypothetical protein EOO46_05480 [Flavobacterium sp.]|nr:MAG: hypothetical protein EOO46_05480 [Flavobacterium sp.]
MKKTILSLAVITLIFTASCKKETTVTTDGDAIVIKEQVTVADGTDLEAAYNNAVIKLEEAKKSGDAEAQKLAQEAVDNAKSAWEATKVKAEEISNDVKEGAQKTGDKIEKSAEEAKKKASETKEEAKKDYNNAVDKMKIK